MASSKESSGIEELIERLRQQGVDEGKVQADQLLDEARYKAEKRLETARQEAESILETARVEADRSRRAGEEAVELAMRDGMLRIKTELVDRFADRVRNLVAKELADGDILRQLIVEVAGRAAPQEDQPAKILLPKDVQGLEQLRREPEELKQGSLSHFVAGITQDMLREGITVSQGEHDSGIRVQLQNSDVEIELSDRSIADLLLKHLVPRFRAIMEGIIQ
ncbi:MAG: hypothetical protein NXI32_05660 [bacterium]|nr:hypothetical protein [bacterium]